MADRDPEVIKQEIDQARDQLAATVDSLSARANPRRILHDIQVATITFLKKPPVAIALIGIGTLSVVVVIRRVRNR